MTDLQTLHDAFSELERQADTFAAQRPDERPDRRRRPLVLAAACVVTVAAVAGGGVLLAGRGGTGTGTGIGARSDQVQPAGGSTASTPVARYGGVTSSPAELARQFRTVLGGMATFTVTDTGHAVTGTAPAAPSSSGPAVSPSAPVPMTPNGAAASNGAAAPNGAAIVGQLTAAGVTGGFDLQVLQSTPGTKAQCDDPDRSACTVRVLADGATLAVGREPLANNPKGITYEVSIVHASGVEMIFHLSNEQDPKGAGPVLAAQPPLTTDQMVSIVLSPRW